MVAIHKLSFVRALRHDELLAELGLVKVRVILKNVHIKFERFVFCHTLTDVLVICGDLCLVLAQLPELSLDQIGLLCLGSGAAH